MPLANQMMMTDDVLKTPEDSSANSDCTVETPIDINLLVKSWHVSLHTCEMWHHGRADDMGPLTLNLCVLTFAEHAAARPTPVIRQDDVACLNKEAPADGRDTHHSTMRNTAPPMRPRTHPETQRRRPRDARPPMARRARPLKPKASTHPPQGAPTRLVPPMQLDAIYQF